MVVNVIMILNVLTIVIMMTTYAMNATLILNVKMITIIQILFVIMEHVKMGLFGQIVIIILSVLIPYFVDLLKDVLNVKII